MIPLHAESAVCTRMSWHKSTRIALTRCSANWTMAATWSAFVHLSTTVQALMTFVVSLKPVVGARLPLESINYLSVSLIALPQPWVRSSLASKPVPS